MRIVNVSRTKEIVFQRLKVRSFVVLCIDHVVSFIPC